MANKIFTLAMLAALTLETSEDPDSDIDALAAQFANEADEGLKKEVGRKYSELAKARNAQVGRKVFYETVVSATKNETARMPEKPVKAAPPATPADGQATPPAPKPAPATTAHVVTQADLDANPSLGEQDVKVGDTIQIPAQPVAAKPAKDRLKITDEIVHEVIKGIAEGQKPKEIAARKFSSGENAGKPLGITADNVYDIYHKRGRFDKFAKEVDEARAVADELARKEKERLEAEKEANKKKKDAEKPAETVTATDAGTTAPAVTLPAASAPVNAVESGAASAAGTENAGEGAGF